MDTNKIKEENKMLRDKLERANQQIKLLAAVLQIVHEDLSMKNEQLEILYSNLRQNPVWQECMATVNSNNNQINKDDTSAQNVMINNNNNNNNNHEIINNNNNTNHNELRHKLLISSDIIETINEDTKCYLNCMAEDTQIALCQFIAFNDLIHLAETNKLWNVIIMDDIVWKLCFNVKWPLDEFTYYSSTDSFSDSSSNTKHKKHEKHEKYEKHEKRKKKKKINKKKLYKARYNYNKTWKEQFVDRIHIEKNWRQGKANVMTLMGHNGSVTDLKFDEYRLITSSDDGSIILWHLDSMKKYKKTIIKDVVPVKDDQQVQAVQLQLNNLYHLNDNWNMNDTKLSAWRHSFVSTFGSAFKNKKKPKAKATAATPNSTLLQNHHYSKDLNFKRLSFQGHGGPIWALDFDNELLVSGSYDKCIKIWNISKGNCRLTLRGHEEWVSGIKLRQYKQYKYVLSCSWDASIRLWKLNDINDINDGAKCISKLHSQSGNAIYCIQWSKDQNFIISGCRHKAIQIWDLQKEKMIKTFMGHLKQVYCIQMINNLILSGSADRTIKLWDSRSANCLGTFNQHMGPVMKLQFDDHKLISAGYDKQVRIFDLRARKQLHSLSGHSKVIFSLQYDSKKIITGSADKRVLVWNFQ